MYPIIHQIAATGVEEEFHTVDLATVRLTGQAGRLMEQVPAGSSATPTPPTKTTTDAGPTRFVDHVLAQSGWLGTEVAVSASRS